MKGCGIMCRCKMGNPKKKSRFICLKCLREGIEGIQRTHQRERGHVKNLHCPYCHEETKHLEIRYCDWFEEMMDKARELHKQYYGTEGEKKMNRYYIHNKTRHKWGWMESNDDLEVGQTVMVKFDNDDIPEMCECEILQVKKGLES